MRKIFKLHPVTKTIYLSKDIRREGFDKEDIEGYLNAVTITLVKPGASLDLAVESLEGVIQDLKLRKKEKIERAQAEANVSKQAENQTIIEKEQPQQQEDEQFQPAPNRMIAALARLKGGR